MPCSLLMILNKGKKNVQKATTSMIGNGTVWYIFTQIAAFLFIIFFVIFYLQDI